MRQHSPADITQIRSTLGQQGVVQRLLLTRRAVDHRHPGSRRALALGQALLDFIAQARVGEHFLVGDEYLADRGVTTLHQGLQLGIHHRQRIAQLMPLLGRRLAA